MRLQFIALAKRELFRIHARYERERPGLGDRCADEIQSAITSIKDHPHAWIRQGQGKGLYPRKGLTLTIGRWCRRSHSTARGRSKGQACGASSPSEANPPAAAGPLPADLEQHGGNAAGLGLQTSTSARLRTWAKSPGLNCPGSTLRSAWRERRRRSPRRASASGGGVRVFGSLVSRKKGYRTCAGAGAVSDWVGD